MSIHTLLDFQSEEDVEEEEVVVVVVEGREVLLFKTLVSKDKRVLAPAPPAPLALSPDFPSWFFFPAIISLVASG
tara:strand:- start:527 stop:751 length:225 start_codon:yes stop_codon:yes gene_type:complete